MEFDRRVQIRVNRLVKGVRKKGFGSGYLVAPRLVLTAAHVLDHLDPDADNPVTVSLPDAGEAEFPASVCWRRADDTVDAALIEITDTHGWQTPQSLADLLIRPPQRYGLMIGTHPHPVTATGFPRMQKDAADGRRLDEQFTGHIAPGTGTLAGWYELTSTDPTFASSDDTATGSRWSGMSGAAVLADDGYGADLLCGVTRRDRQADRGGTRLTATPAAQLLADETFRALITEHTGWEPVLEPVEPAHLLTPAAVDRNLRSPAALLRADAEAVTFLGRDGELADLEAWCRNDQPAIDIRVLTGPGGQGKTRLARRLTDILSWHGWATGHVSSDLTDDPPADAAPPDFTTLTTPLPLLLVVDYAETRPRLLRRLITHLHRTRHRVRLLLLARSDGQWRTGSLQSVPAVRDLLEEAPVIPLTPLIPTSQPAQGRHDAFRQAVHDLARLLPLLPTMPTHDWTFLADDLRPPADLNDYRYDNVLTLQMTALVALLQQGPRPVDTAAGTPPERTLLKHEDRFWEATAKSPAYKLDLPAATLSAAVAVAALCGSATKDEALHVIAVLPGLSAPQMEPAAAWLASLYPSSGGRYWGSLQPDRVAEYQASRALADGDLKLPVLLDVAAPGQQAQIITVLARAAIGHYNAGRTNYSEHILHAIDTALDTISLAYRAAANAADALPYPSRVTDHLAIRLITSLVDANRQLAAENPDAHEPDLARSLSNLSIHLAQVGQESEALAVTQQAVQIYRRLAAEDPAAHEPHLARTLSNLSIHLAQVGQESEALAVTQQAVQIFQQLTADNQAAHEPDLARSLSNLGGSLAQAGRQREALAVTEQAVQIFQRLTADNQAAHEPDLATALSNLGNRLVEAGRGREALAVTEQAVQIYQQLTADNAAAHEPGLARSLDNLGVRLMEAGRGREALAVTKQAVQIYQQLTADNAAAHESDFARSLSNLGIRLGRAGRPGEALAVTEQALQIRRQLAAGNPAAYEPGLGVSLTNLGVRLADAGRHLEALSVTEQAVEIYRRLAAANTAVYEPDLAHSLSNLGNHLAEEGRGAEALAVTEQAVEIYRRLAAANTAVYEPDLARSLSNLGIRLAQARQGSEALAVAGQAVLILRRLAADNPAAHEPDLAHSLGFIASLLSAGDDLSVSLRMTGEAVELYRRHVAAMPPLIGRLHHLLKLQADLLGNLGRAEEAETVRRWLSNNPPPGTLDAAPQA